MTQHYDYMNKHMEELYRSEKKLSTFYDQLMLQSISICYEASIVLRSFFLPMLAGTSFQFNLSTKGRNSNIAIAN